MPVAATYCRGQLGLHAPLVQVEVNLGSGLPMFSIVGLPAAAVRESKDRVRAALTNSGSQFPAGRVTVNLAPADLLKEGGRFDRPSRSEFSSLRVSCREHERPNRSSTESSV